MRERVERALTECERRQMPDLLVETFKKLEGQFNECQDGVSASDSSLCILQSSR